VQKKLRPRPPCEREVLCHVIKEKSREAWKPQEKKKSIKGKNHGVYSGRRKGEEKGVAELEKEKGPSKSDRKMKGKFLKGPLVGQREGRN